MLMQCLPAPALHHHPWLTLTTKGSQLLAFLMTVCPCRGVCRTQVPCFPRLTPCRQQCLTRLCRIAWRPRPGPSRRNNRRRERQRNSKRRRAFASAAVRKGGSVRPSMRPLLQRCAGFVSAMGRVRFSTLAVAGSLCFRNLVGPRHNTCKSQDPKAHRARRTTWVSKLTRSVVSMPTIRA